MRVAVNALSIRPDMAGGRTFALGLVRALVHSARGHEVLVVGNPSAKSLFDARGAGFIPVGKELTGPLQRIRYERKALAEHLAKHSLDVLLCPDGTVPAQLSCRAIAIFQNLIYFTLTRQPRLAGGSVSSRLYGRLQTKYFLSEWGRALDEAAGCIAVSGAAKAAFTDHFGERAGRIRVIHEGVDPVFSPAAGPDLEHPYLLGVGTLYPHKHFENLLELLAHTAVPPNVHLILAGADWHGEAARLRGCARRLGIEQRLEFRGHCTGSDLLALYRGALCLGAFSEVEAFGLPVAEANACGTPAIVARRSAMPEVGGSGALALDDGQTEEGAHFIRRLLTDAEFRGERSAAALCSAARFDWRELGRQYWHYIEATAADTQRQAEPIHFHVARREALYRRLPVVLQHAAATYTGWQNKRQRHGEEFHRELAFLEQSESYSRMELQAVQRDRLEKLVRTAYAHVPFYRDLFHRLRLTPQDIRVPDDLKKLPVLEKFQVRQAGMSMVNQALSKEHRILGHTSGSTGTALALVYDRAALAAEFATVWRLRRRFGCDLGAWHATLAGRLLVPRRRTRPPFHRINRAQHQLLFSLYHLNASTAKHYAAALLRRPLAYYSGYPSGLEALAAVCRQAGLEPPRPRLALFTSSESLLSRQRTQLESGFGVPVRDRYGCAEFCVSFSECEEGRYHLDSEFAIVEVEPMEETEDRVTGSLVCTGLTNLAMPFIRYRVGDVITLAKSLCPCGRKSLSALEIDGRREDYVVTQDGVRLGRLDHLFKDLPGIAESQIEQSEAGRMKIRIVRGPEFARSDEQRLLDECFLRMGHSMEVELEYTDAIARTSAGKFRSVINSLPEAQRYV